MLSVTNRNITTFYALPSGVCIRWTGLDLPLLFISLINVCMFLSLRDMMEVLDSPDGKQGIVDGMLSTENKVGLVVVYAKASV